MKTQLDPIDTALLVVTSMTGFIVTGIGSFDLFGVNFAETVWTVEGIALSTAWVLGFAAIVLTVATNDNTSLGSLRDDVQNLDQYYAGAVFGTLALMIGWVVFPSTVAHFFQSADLWGLVYVGTVTSGQFVMGWIL